MGRVRFSLPGVFTYNPTPDFVNFALWSVAPEILCYVAMTALMVSGYYKNKRALLAITLAYAAVCIAADSIFPPAQVAEVLPAKNLILSFLVGALFFVFRDRIGYSRAAAALSFVAATLAIFAAQTYSASLLTYAAIPAYIYVIAVVGLTNLPKIPFLSSGDYSYGVYIYGYPIQQTIAHFSAKQNALIDFAIALPITLLVACASWHRVEKPFLSLRSRFKSSTAGEIARPVAWLIFLALYAVALSYWTGIYPVKDVAKFLLRVLGLYH